MQKLNTKIFDKISTNKLKTNHITLLLYIARYQDTHGQLKNLTYRLVTKETGMSKQTFYSSLRSLESMNIISVTKSKNYGYFDVTILDNDFSDCETKEDYIKKPYISTNKYAFLYSNDFIKLSGACKRLILSIIRRLGKYTKTRLRMKTLREFATVTSDRSIYKFLKFIRKWFDVTKVGTTYILTITSETFKIKDSMSENENEVSYQLKVKCDKKKAEYSLKDLEQTAKLYTCNKYYEKYGKLFEKIVNKVIEVKGSLEYKLINWTLQDALNKLGIPKKYADISETEQEFIDNIEEWYGKEDEDFFIPFSRA